MSDLFFNYLNSLSSRERKILRSLLKGFIKMKSPTEPVCAKPIKVEFPKDKLVSRKVASQYLGIDYNKLLYLTKTHVIKNIIKYKRRFYSLVELEKTRQKMLYFDSLQR